MVIFFLDNSLGILTRIQASKMIVKSDDLQSDDLYNYSGSDRTSNPNFARDPISLCVMFHCNNLYIFKCGVNFKEFKNRLLSTFLIPFQ